MSQSCADWLDGVIHLCEYLHTINGDIPADMEVEVEVVPKFPPP